VPFSRKRRSSLDGFIGVWRFVFGYGRGWLGYLVFAERGRYFPFRASWKMLR
jgi:hypothetical protein